VGVEELGGETPTALTETNRSEHRPELAGEGDALASPWTRGEVDVLSAEVGQQPATRRRRAAVCRDAHVRA
jgi:hypothetical protein